MTLRYAAGVFAALLCATACSQSPVVSPCGPPPVAASNSQPNIFSEQQEQWLGDAMADMLEGDVKPSRDPSLSAYLQGIEDKLVATLPPTKIVFRVQLIDSSEVNGFSIAGGRIYINRKLAAISQSEDEMAAVLGHETGHIASHQFAFETTRDMKRLLNVTSVGDRADVYAKFQALMDARYKDKHPGKSGDDDEGQGEADKMGVYVAAAAGYRPAAFAEFWNRSFFVNGKTGSKLSDFFGITKPDQKRLRGMMKLAAAVPAGCGATEAHQTNEFMAWRRKVVENQAVVAAPKEATLSEVKLSPPLRMDLDRLRFSPDGKMILAQDESSVYAISREPFATQFRFDAENALPAQFSPDSQKIVFGTPGLHTEEWSVAEKKMLSAHEPISRHQCYQAKMSPDGRTIICTTVDFDNAALNLELLDAASGDVLFAKKPFFHPSLIFVYMLFYAQAIEVDVMPSSFSSDGNYLLIGPENEKLAFDMRTRQQIKIGNDLKNKVGETYAFLSNDRVVGINTQNSKDSGIFSFPEGQQTRKIDLALAQLYSIAANEGTEYVFTSQPATHKLALVDLATSRIVLTSTVRAVDVWKGLLVGEERDGAVAMLKLEGGKLTDRKRVVLPVSPLGGPRAVAISKDGQYLALSSGSRGGVWDLKTGERKTLLLGFTGSSWSDDGVLHAEFPKLDKLERRMAEISFAPAVSVKTATFKLDDATHMKFGRLMEWKEKTKAGTELVVHQVSDDSPMWSKMFAEGAPYYTASYGDLDFLFSYPLKSNTAKGRLKAESALNAQASAVKDKDNARLIEVVDQLTGKTLAEMVLERPMNYAGVGGLNRLGDLLYVQGDDNRTMVYSLKTGKQVRQIFGFVVGADVPTQRVVTVNRRDEAIVYDADGKELTHFHGGSPLRFAGLQGGATRLVLLSADQVVRTVAVGTDQPDGAAVAAAK